MAASGPLTAALVSRTVMAPGIVDLVFGMRSPARLEFKAGQFVSMAVGQDGAGITVRRSYSIASLTDAGDRLRFIVRVIPEGMASEFLMALPIGGEVQMTGPHGFFVLDREHPGDVVFGATGTGVAALLPMLHELMPRAKPRRRLVYWGVRQESDLYVTDELAQLCRDANAELAIHLTAPGPGWTGRSGRITPAILAELPALVSPTFYLVGNGAMIGELKRELVARGVDRKKQVRTEAFFD